MNGSRDNTDRALMRVREIPDEHLEIALKELEKLISTEKDLYIKNEMEWMCIYIKERLLNIEKDRAYSKAMAKAWEKQQEENKEKAVGCITFLIILGVLAVLSVVLLIATS